MLHDNNKTCPRSIDKMIIKHNKNNFLKIASAASFILLLGGCAGTRTANQENMNTHLATSNYRAIASVYLKDGKPNYDKENLLDTLEAGKAFNDAAMWKESQEAFALSSKHLHWKEDTVDTPSEVMNLIGTTLTSSAYGAYQGKIFEGGLIDYYQAINELMLGNEQGARVEFNRFEVRMSNAQAQFSSYRKNIQKQNETELKQENASTSKTSFDGIKPQLQEGISNVPSNLPDAKIRIAVGEFMSGAFRASSSVASDKNASKVADPIRSASTASSTKAGTQLANQTVQQLKSSAHTAKKKVFVLYEDGRGPSYSEFRIDLPLFLLTDKVTYTGIALPKFNPGQPAFGNLKVNNVPSVELTNITNISGMDFNVAYPGIVTKAIVSTVVKTAVQAVANTAIDQQTKESSPLLGSFLKLGVGAAQAATTTADTRSWVNLPNTIQLAVLNWPASNTLTLSDAAGTKLLDVSLPDAENVLVLVKASGTGAAPTAYVAELPANTGKMVVAKR